MHLALTIVLSLTLVVLGAQPAAAQSVEQAAQAWFASDEPSAAALSAADARWSGLLALERLPSGAYLAEAALAVGDKRLRYPLKMTREDATWTVAWAPVPSFGAALVALAKSGYLPEAHPERRWSDVARLPALSIVATKARFVTPFGEVSPNDTSNQPPQGDLAWSPLLLDHARRWIRDVLDDDPAPAGFDLLLAGNLDWRAANKIVLNLSAAGLYQIWFVVGGGQAGQLGVVTAEAPVTKAAANAPAVAVYPLDDGRFGVRLASDAAAERCSDEYELCIESPAELAGRLERWLQPGGSHATFAAVGDLQIGPAVAMLAALADYMGLEDHHIVVGYVQR